jgi:hypothetical protein
MMASVYFAVGAARMIVIHNLDVLLLDCSNQLLERLREGVRRLLSPHRRALICPCLATLARCYGRE